VFPLTESERDHHSVAHLGRSPPRARARAIFCMTTIQNGTSPIFCHTETHPVRSALKMRRWANRAKLEAQALKEAMGAPIRSFPELSLSPVFRRQWPSVYTAIEDGRQDVEWLERYFVEQIPVTGVKRQLDLPVGDN